MKNRDLMKKEDERQINVEFLEPRILFSGSPTPAPEADTGSNEQVQESTTADAPSEVTEENGDVGVATPPANTDAGSGSSDSSGL